MLLPGAPDQPFQQRFNLACGAHLSTPTAFIGLASLLLFSLRFPTPGLLNKLFMGTQAAVFVGEVWWRRRSLAQPNGGTYARYRELLVAVLRLNEALLGSRCLWIKAWLDTVGPGDGSTGWQAMARHVGVLVNGSSVLVRLMIWAAPMRISWALPLHILMAASLIPHNREACTSAALSAPAPRALSTRALSAVQAVRYSVLLQGSTLSLPELDQCALLLTYSHLVLGLVLPALALAVFEACLFEGHQRQRREAGLPPERGWHARVCALVHGFLEDLDSLGWAAALWMLLGVLFDVAVAASAARVAQPR